MNKTKKPVVKENLTSEERAREYANSALPYANDIDAGYEQWIAWDNARLGYLSALKYSEKELTAYREALKEIVKQVPRCNFNLSTSISYSEANRLDELIDKAKQLLKEEE